MHIMVAFPKDTTVNGSGHLTKSQNHILLSKGCHGTVYLCPWGALVGIAGAPGTIPVVYSSSPISVKGSPQEPTSILSEVEGIKLLKDILENLAVLLLVTLETKQGAH